MGRLCDWFDKHPGMIRSPMESKEASAIAAAGYGAGRADPGVLLVEKVWAYCQRHHPKTRVMASGLRTKAEALALAGCDFLVVGPKVMAALGASTLEGYNDGLHVSDVEPAATISARLSPAFAAAFEFEAQELEVVDHAAFENRLGLAGQELLAEGVQRLVEDANRLEPYFVNMVGGQE